MLLYPLRDQSSLLWILLGIELQDGHAAGVRSPPRLDHSPSVAGRPIRRDRYAGLPLNCCLFVIPLSNNVFRNCCLCNTAVYRWEPNSPVLQRISCTDSQKRRASPPDLRDLRRIPGGKVDLNRIASFVHHPLAHRESTRRVSQIPAVATLRSRASARPSRWRCWRASPRGLAAFEHRPRRSRAEASTSAQTAASSYSRPAGRPGP